MKNIKNKLTEVVKDYMARGTQNINVKELSEVIDMIKDLSMTMYYDSVVEAMEGNEAWDYDAMEMPEALTMGRYSKKTYTEGYNKGLAVGRNLTKRDYREGRSGTARKTYMDTKDAHLPSEEKLKELDAYLNELAVDMAEMVAGMSPEEKTMLKAKLSNLANKM